MKQKMRFTAALAAVIALLAGTALAVASHLNVLEVFFEGDTAPARELVDSSPRTVSDEDFTLTVESSVSDGKIAYLLVTVTAKTDEAVERLMADSFVDMDTFGWRYINDEEAKPTRGGTEIVVESMGSDEIEDRETERSRTWAIDMNVYEYTTAIRFWLGAMGQENALEIPLNQAQVVTVPIGATGAGAPGLYNAAGGTITIEQVTLSPFTCQLVVEREQDIAPVVFFRMADGSLRTSGQMMHFTDSSNGIAGNASKGTWNCKFYSLQALDQISGIIAFGKEYPLNGGEPFDVTVDEKLYPFQVPLMERLSEDGGYSVPVRALCQGLGASCVWDNAAGTATCTYRGVSVVLALGSDTALVDGQRVPLENPVGVQNGKLVTDYDIFRDSWKIELMAAYDKPGGERVSWVVTP